MGTSSSALFSTVPSHDYLQLWQAGRFQPRRVVRFLNLSKEDVARVAGIALSSVRFDRKAPRDLLDRLVDVATTCTLVAQFFEGNAVKAALWFKTANPLMGDLSPRDMIRGGRHNELRRFVLEALGEKAPAPSALPRETHSSAGAASGASAGAAVESFLDRYREPVAALCRRYGAARLALFGALLGAELDPDRSDVGLVVEFASASGRSPARQYFELKTALEELFGRAVDLVELYAVPDSRLRRVIERTQVPLYTEVGKEGDRGTRTSRV